MTNPLATIAPERLAALVNIVGKGIAAAPENLTMADRIRATLDRLPDDVVREIRDAGSLLADLATERLSQPSPGVATVHGETYRMEPGT